MVLCGSAVPFSSVDDLPGLSLPSHVQVVFHNRCCHGKAVAGTDVWSANVDKIDLSLHRRSQPSVIDVNVRCRSSIFDLDSRCSMSITDV